jgi:hypothetical protein
MQRHFLALIEAAGTAGSVMEHRGRILNLGARDD